MGGARITLAVFVGMGLATLAAIAGVDAHSFPLFFGAYMAVFLLAGMGNGSTYRMIPCIFAELGRRAGGDTVDYKRRAAAVIGIAGAIGAFGGVLVNVAFRQSFLTYHTGDAAYATFIAFYAVCVVVTWAVYLRPRHLRSAI